MKYKGYTISEDMTGFAPKHSRFSFFLEDGEKLIGNGYSIADCKNQIDGIIN